MADRNQFDDFTGFDDFEDLSPACAVCETMVPDAADGLLSEAEQRAFDKHVANCQECARELAEAQRGAAWLSLLKTQAPTPPEDLLARILAQTSGATLHGSNQHGSTQHIALPLAVPSTAPPPPSAHIAPRPARLRPSHAWTLQWSALRTNLRDTFSIQSAQATFQPRIAMTAAMAFFSIALTLNLTGVRVRDLRPSNFTPSALKRTAADVDASATRMFQNNRAVYQVESRLSELQSDDAPGNPTSDSR